MRNSSNIRDIEQGGPVPNSNRQHGTVGCSTGPDEIGETDRQTIADAQDFEVDGRTSHGAISDAIVLLQDVPSGRSRVSIHGNHTCVIPWLLTRQL